MKEGGVKFDGEKLRYDLIPWQALEEAAKVLTHGAKKYAPGNWKKVPDAKNRYYAALMRHLQEVRKGNLIDDDSGYSHLAHVLCNAMFLVYLYDEAPVELVDEAPVEVVDEAPEVVTLNSKALSALGSFNALVISDIDRINRSIAKAGKGDLLVTANYGDKEVVRKVLAYFEMQGYSIDVFDDDGWFYTLRM